MMVKCEEGQAEKINCCHLPLITEILRLEPLNFCQLDLVEKKGEGHQSSIFRSSLDSWNAAETGLVLFAIMLHLH